jgi:Na+/proline symporter
MACPTKLYRFYAKVKHAPYTSLSTLPLQTKSIFFLFYFSLISTFDTYIYPSTPSHNSSTKTKKKKIHSKNIIFFSFCLIFALLVPGLLSYNLFCLLKKYVRGLGVQQRRVSIGRESSSGGVRRKAWEEEDVGSLTDGGSGNFLCFS